MKKMSFVSVCKKIFITIFVLLYISLLIIFYKTYFDYFLPEKTFTIIDLSNYSYIEYISDLIFIPLNEEENIINQNNSLINKNKTFYYKKLSLYNYKKNIFCECKNDKKEIIISKDINMCYFLNCDIKINNSEINIYPIYKWNNKFIYANISRYYLNQGINPVTKKCAKDLGFISCGFYENINNEICIKNKTMKCPLKIYKNKNIIYNNINIIFDIKNKNDYELKDNINLLDIFPEVIINNNNINLIYEKNIYDFFNENELGFPFKNINITDKIYLYPNNNNNQLLYNSTIINNDNFFIIHFESPGAYTNNLYYELLSAFYWVMNLFLSNFFFNLFNMLMLIDFFYRYNCNFKKYQDNLIFYIYIYKIIESPISFYFIFNLRKLKNIYKEHIWDKIFLQQLNIEKRFYKINLILFGIFYILFPLMCILYFIQKHPKKEIKKDNNISFVQIK